MTNTNEDIYNCQQCRWSSDGWDEAYMHGELTGHEIDGGGR